MSITVCILIGVMVWFILAWFMRDELYPTGFFVGLFISCSLSWLFLGEQLESTKQREIENRAQKIKESTPHIIREADGCKVYRFKSDERWHYYTRCADKTTTESSYTVRSGKTTRTETESITTVNKPLDKQELKR